jgi:hypothetical protein
VNTLTSVILSALQDTRDRGHTIEERAEAIADAVRAETPEPPTGALGQWIASLRVGDTLTVDDIHRFVRVELALRNADKHHAQARGAQNMTAADHIAALVAMGAQHSPDNDAFTDLPMLILPPEMTL